MQYLPSFICGIIDSVAYKQELDPYSEDWDNWKSDFETYFKQESDYALSEDDERYVGNIPSLLQALERSVESTFAGENVLEELIKNSIAFFEVHDKFYNARERQYFVRSAPIDRLLKVSIACLQGRASSEAVHKREVDGALAVDVLQSIFQTAHPELPEELNQGTIDGLKRANKAFHMLADHPQEIPKEVLEEVVFELESAGELLAHLPDLMNRFQQEHGCIIPVIGEAVSALRANPNDEELLSILRENVFPAFLEMYETRQDGWLLEPEVAHDLLSDANEGIVQLHELLESYPEYSEEFWQTVEQLEQTFREIKAHTMQLDELRTSGYWPEAQMLLNLLRGGAPRYAAATFVSGVKEGDAPEIIRNISQKILSYLKESDPVFLLEALELLRQDQELAKTTRPCASCGSRIALDAKICPLCNTKVEELSLSG